MRSDLSTRFWSKVDKSGDCWLWTAGTFGTGYGAFGIDGKMHSAHRVAYELENGPIPPKLVIDHICHTPKCVRPSHLRAATVKQNLENRGGLDANNTSGVRGVHWNKNAGKWQARVKHEDKLIHIGYYADLNEAKEAAVAKRNELFSHNDLDRREQAIQEAAEVFAHWLTTDQEVAA